MLTEKQISALRASFPAEALSADTSRGFELTSIKAAYVVERLNEVFGPCGCGWRYVHSPFEWIESEVLTEVALQFKVTDGGGVNPVVWDAEVHGWGFVQDGEAWSWPIFSPGGRRPGKGMTPLTDARKGAITDGLTKAASMIGVGHEVFKGLLRVGDKEQRPVRQPEQPKAAPANGSPARPLAPTNGHAKPAPATPPQAGAQIGTGSDFGKSNGASAKPGRVNGADHSADSPKTGNGFRNGGSNGVVALAQEPTSTTFWMLANQHAGQLERASVSALAKEVVTGKMSWLEAQTILHDMIEDTSMLTSGVVHNPREAMHEKVSDPLDELFM